MMELLVKKLSCSALPVDQLKQELDAVLPKEKQKGNQLPWVDVVKCLFSRAADSSSETLFENVFKIIEINIEKTVQRVLRNSKKDGHIYCASLSSLVSHIQYSVEDMDVPVAAVNKLSALLLSAVIDIESASVRAGEETAAVSRIFLKLTLLLGHHQEYVLDTLLHCKTLLYCSARQPLIFVPLIKRVFTSLKNKSPQSPHLYLKYLLLGKLWLFMTKKEEVGKMRTYIINSVRPPKSFVDWAVQNQIPWLKLSEWNSQLILRNMTVSNALRTLYSDDMPASQGNDIRKSKKKKGESVNEAYNAKTKQDVCGKILQKKYGKDMSGKVCDEIDNTKFKPKQKVLQSCHIEQEEESCILRGMTNKNIHEPATEVHEEEETKVSNRLNSYTINSKEELDKTQDKKLLLDAPDRKTKKIKTHDIREEEKERKEKMLDTGKIKTLKRKNLEIKRENSSKKNKVIGNENEMKSNQFEVLDRRWKGKNSKNVEARIFSKNETSVGVEKQIQGSSDRGELKSNAPRFFDRIVSESSLPLGMMARKQMEKRKQMPGKSHFPGLRERKQGDQAQYKNVFNIVSQLKRKSASNRAGEKSSTSHASARASKYSGKREQRSSLTRHKAAIHKIIRRESVTFTVTDFKQVTNKSLKIDCEERCQGDRALVENKEVNEDTGNAVSPKGKNGAVVSMAVVNTEVCDGYNEDSKVFSELLDCHNEMSDDLHNNESKLPGELHSRENSTLNMGRGGKNLGINTYNDNVKKKLDNEDVEIIELDSDLSDNEACEKTGNGKKELINITYATREELSRDSYGNFSEVRDESNSSGEESDGESDEDVALGLVNQTSILHQEVKHPSEAMGRVAKKAGNSNESKAFGEEGEGNELERTSETTEEGLDRNSDGSVSEMEDESGGTDNELDGESYDSSDGETETTDQEDETAILQEEIMKPTEKMANVVKETRELTETLGTSDKNSITPAVCAENSDSDLEIVHVEEANPRQIKLYNNKIITLEDHACDIDEASGSDSDIIPCDEKTKMFTDEETKNYHNKLMEAVMQSKVENILKEEERELKRKMIKEEKTTSIDPTDENHKDIGNSTDKETITKKTVSCEDLVSQMINKLYKPTATVESKQVEESSDPESDSDNDIEVVLQTIVKDTGRLTSIHGLRERLLSSTVIKDEPDDSEGQKEFYENRRQETEVPENPVDCSEKFKEGQGEKTEALDTEKFCGTKDQETEVIIDEELVGSKECFCEKPKNEDQEIQVVEKVGDIIKPKETEISKNIIKYTKKSPKSEDQSMEVFDGIFDHSEVDNRVLLRRGSTHETQRESGNELNVNLKNNDIDLQIASTASYERSFIHDAVSHQSDVEEVDVRFLPNTSTQMQENGDDKCFSLKSETDDGVEPSCDLELYKKHLLNDINCSIESGIDNINLLVAEVEVKDEVIKEEGIHIDDSVASVGGNETVMEANFSGKYEATVSNGKLDNDQEFSSCEKHTHIDSVAGVNNCESSPSVADVDPPVVESLRISVDTPEIYKSKVTETASSKRSEAKDFPGFSENITDSINRVVEHNKSIVGTTNTELESVTEENPTVVGTMNTELESVTEESEEKSTEGADEAYEASSDASEDPAPRTRRRTRSLRRSFTHTVVPEASDSDASPEQRTRRTRRTSDMTGSTHLGPLKKRNQSSCLAVANSVSGASGTLQGSQTSLSVYAVGERDDLKKLTACSKLGTSSGFASHCESDFSSNSQKLQDASGNMDASKASSLTGDLVNRFHTVSSSSPKTSGSASGALIENVGADGSTDSVFRLQLQNVPEKSLSLPPARRSIRIFEKIASQQKRQFDDAFGVSKSVSGKALGGKSAKNMKTSVLTRSVRCTMSDSETVLNHSLHLNTGNGKTNTSSSLFHSSLGSAFPHKEYETCNHEVENVPSINRGCDDSCNTICGDKNSSFENLSSGNLHNNESRDACSLDVWVTGKSGNHSEYLDKEGTLAIDILSSGAPERVEEEQQELGGKNSWKLCKRENQKSECDYLQKVDAEKKSNLSIGIVKSSDHISGSKKNTENARNMLNEKKNKIEIETDDQNHDRVEEYLDEKEGEELEVLSTSGMEENEAPCCSFSANASASDSEEQRSIMNEKVETFVSQKSLRTPSCHRPRGRSGKKEVSVDVKKDDIHPAIPPLKVHCVSEAVLAKEVLISPEVSDEECELVSPGVDNDVNEAESVPLPECLETSPKQKPSPITIPSHSMRKKSGGIRSPQKMIPEEQDETTLLRYKVENVSRPSQTPKVKSAVSLGTQDKVKTKASCTVGTSDKGMLTRKLTKTAVNEVNSVVLPKVDLLKSKYPARNKACITDIDFPLAESPRNFFLSGRSKSLVKKTAQESLVTKVDMIEQSCKTKDLENTVEIIDRATVQSVRSTKGRKHKEGLNESPVTANHQTTNNDMMIDMGSSENTAIIFATVNAGISGESSIHEEPALKLPPLKRKSLEKGFDANFALEEMIINEKFPLEIENVKSLKNGVEPQKDEEKTNQFVETPSKHLSSLSHSMDGTVLGECSSVSSQSLSSPLRRSLRLKTSVRTSSSKTYEKPRIHRIDSSSLKGIVAKDEPPVEVTSSPSLARLDELPSRSGTLITSRSPYLTMKASPRKFNPASSLSSSNNESSLESSSTRDKLSSRSSPEKSESQFGSSLKKDEVPAPLSLKKMESVIGLASNDEESAAGKFIRCASSPIRSSPRLCRSSSYRDESCLRSTASREESPVRSSFRKEGSPSRLFFSGNESVKCPSICKVRSSPTRQDVASPRSSLSNKESPTRSSLCLRTQVHLSSREESSNTSSCNENISPDDSSIRRIRSPKRPFLKRNESPVRSSPGKTPLSKNESLARSFHEEDESSTGLSISRDIPQMRSSPKHMKFPISSFPIENESLARLSLSKKDSLADFQESPADFLSLQSKTSTSLNKDEPLSRSSFGILLATKVSSRHKSSSSKSPVRPSVSKNESPARLSLRKNELPDKSTSSKNHSPTGTSSESLAMLSSKNEVQSKLPLSFTESPAKSTSCKSELPATSSFTNSSLSGVQPNDEGVADLVGMRSLRHRQVTYSMTKM